MVGPPNPLPEPIAERLDSFRQVRADVVVGIFLWIGLLVAERSAMSGGITGLLVSFILMTPPDGMGGSSPRAHCGETPRPSRACGVGFQA